MSYRTIRAKNMTRHKHVLYVHNMEIIFIWIKSAVPQNKARV